MSDKKKGGRPTKLDRDTQETIIGAIKIGSPIEIACALAGVASNTYRDWMKRGHAGEYPYDDFLLEVNKAIAFAVVQPLARIQAAGKKGAWQADAWRLERRFARFFAQRSPSQNELHDTLKAGLAAIVAAFGGRDDEHVLRALNALASGDSPASDPAKDLLAQIEGIREGD